jgi:hypothetical protein
MVLEMTTMTFEADLVVRDETRRPLTVVEIRNATALTPEWADEIAAQVAAGASGLRVRYVLVLSQDFGYIWSLTTDGSVDVATRTQFDMRPIVTAYSGGDTGPERLRHAELRMTVFAWLLDVVLRQPLDWSPPGPAALESFLRDIGGGRVSMEEPI